MSAYVHGASTRDVGAEESEESWSELLAHLNERGLRAVQLVIADAHAGIAKAVRRHLSTDAASVPRTGSSGSKEDFPLPGSSTAFPEGGGPQPLRLSAAAIARDEDENSMTVDRDLSDAIVLYVGYKAENCPRLDRSRLVSRFGEARVGEFELRVKSVLAELGRIEVNWEVHDLASGSDLARDAMHARHPELSEQALDALRWRFSYDWK